MKLIKHFLFFFLLMFWAVPGMAKNKITVIKPPTRNFDFQAVQDIVVLPITATKVDFGEVDPKRLPKIKALLAKMQGAIRRQIVDGSKLSEATKHFHYASPNQKSTTVVLKLNFDQFDNGNQSTRAITSHVGMGLFKKGQAEVTLRAQILNARTQVVLTEFTSYGEGMTGTTGGFDSNMLYRAASEANGRMYKHLSKLIDNKYKRFANLGEKAKTSTHDQIETTKEEKREIKNP